MFNNTERILVLAKTYPSPSAKYVETSCIAGINDQGVMRRLYPVPFRFIEKGQRFRKWQWIEARVRKAKEDHRYESHRIDIETLACGEWLSTKNQWEARREWIEKLPSFCNPDALDEARADIGLSLGLIQPIKICSLEIVKSAKSAWTEDEKAKLRQAQMQGNLFDEMAAAQQVRELQKIPFDFYYHYVCSTGGGERIFKNKVIDWEVGALYWNCRKLYGSAWEAQFRAKLEKQLANTELMFLMGNQHRFQNQWLIISLIYPAARSVAPQIKLL